MIRSLVRKELREMLPMLGLVGVLFIGGTFLNTALTHCPDQYSLEDSGHAILEDEAGVVRFFVAFTMALGLLVREHDRGAIEFLDALPVRRTTIFVVKVVLANLVLALASVLEIGSYLTFHFLSRSSLDASFHPGVFLPLLGLQLVQNLVFLSVGLCLSWLRRFAWIILGGLIFLYVLLQQYVPQLELFNLLSLCEAELEGYRVLIPWPQVGVLLGVGLLCLTAAWGLWLGGGAWCLRLLARLGQRGWGKALLVVTGLLAVGLWVGLFIWFAETSTDGDQGAEGETVHYPTWQLSRVTTKEFTFTYPEYRSEQAMALAEVADQAGSQVRGFLGAEVGHPIRVDLTGAAPGAAGTAHWQKIRMDIEGGAVEDRLAILAHEATHVHIDALSDMRMHDAFGSTRFFHEGLASYLEHRFFRDQEELDRMRTIAAVLRAWDQVRFEVLCDDDELTREQDTYVVYPLGEAFVAALVERHGDEAPGQVLQAFREGLADLSGESLWQEALQKAGFNLDPVVDGFLQLLDQEVERHQDLIDRLPRLRGSVVARGHRIGIRPEIVGEPAWEMICRFRPERDALPWHYQVIQADAEGIFWIDRSLVTGRQLSYQLGYAEPEERHGVFEPWVEAPL